MRFSKSCEGQAKVLSMYYGSPMIYEDQLFNSAIQLISWHKCKHPVYRHAILESDNMRAGFLGTSLGRGFLARHSKTEVFSLRSNWEAIAYKVISKIVRLKLEQNPVIMKILLDTEDQVLVENEQPVYWETEPTKNRTGKLLMQLRKRYG